MKQLVFEYKGYTWTIVLSLDAFGLCDVSIYRRRENKKWWQCLWEDFSELTCCPDNLDDVISIAKDRIDVKLEQLERVEKLKKQYNELENVTFYEKDQSI